MVEIPEYKRDESKDYLNVLKSLNEIPFPVGKNLLADFLLGDSTNRSIKKNKLYDKINFGIMDFSNKGVIFKIIYDLLDKGFIEDSPSMFNRMISVLTITRKGQDELTNPKFEKEEKIKELEIKTEITDKDIQAFKELQDFLGDLNQEQKKAVISSHPNILCIAGAGSGKTTVLTKRIHFLNKMQKISSENILAITFTRKAKEQMQKRLEKLGVEGAHVETFNSFCEKTLLKNTGRIYGRKMKVATFQDKMMSVLNALESLNLNIEDATYRYFSPSQRRNKNQYQLQATFVSDCFSVLEYYKTTQKTLDDFSTNLRGKDYENAKMLYSIVKFLLQYMKMNNLRTYTDQINHAIDFFKNNPKHIPNYEHVLIDEYQDVNSQQVKLLRLLSPKAIFHVGDPRQSIFGWRGSDVRFILDLVKKENVEIINLKKNYRSNSHIVDFMNKGIKYMKLTDLESNFKGEDSIKVYSFPTDQAEMDFVAKKILNSEIERKDIFVLARTNKQLTDLSNIMKKMGIKHILRNDESKEIQAKEGEVTLATIHSIKGLEAQEVFVIGCTTKNFPCFATEHPIMSLVKMYEYDKIDEERRLFYVAISRAKHKLHLTYSGKNHSYFINSEMKKIIDFVEY